MKINAKVTLQYLSSLCNQKYAEKNVMPLLIIIGILLTVIALPGLLTTTCACGSGSKKSELKTAVGTTIRSQMAYHFERREFSPNLEELGLEKIAEGADYLDSVTVTVKDNFATVISNNAEFRKDDTPAYSAAIEFDSGVYRQILCQTDSIAESGIAPTNAKNCPDNTSELR